MIGDSDRQTATAERLRTEAPANAFVYLVISQRARGLSLRVNLNPDKACNFDCVYCEIDRSVPVGPRSAEVDTHVLARELEDMLYVLAADGVQSLPGWEQIPPELSRLKQVALSGDGEPTLCPNFEEVVQTVLHVRARGLVPFFKIVLVTNGTGLHREDVRRALRLLTSRDQIWVKLDVGSQRAMEEINRPRPAAAGAAPRFEAVLDNIIQLGRERPLIIQSLFSSVNGKTPTTEQVDDYIGCLERLKREGAQIPLIQVYSMERPAGRNERHAAVAASGMKNAEGGELRPVLPCGHLPLRTLSNIARRIRAAGLQAEVF